MEQCLMTAVSRPLIPLFHGLFEKLCPMSVSRREGGAVSCLLFGGRASVAVRPRRRGRTATEARAHDRAGAAANRKARRDEKLPPFGKEPALFFHKNCGRMFFKKAQKTSLRTASDLSSGKSGTCRR